MKSPADSQKWLKKFKESATTQLVELREGLLKLQPSRNGNRTLSLDEAFTLNPDLRELYRLAHTVKGSAKMVGQGEIARQAGELEITLGRVLTEPYIFNEELRRSMITRLETLSQEVALLGPQ